jgi:hypothetical protein
MNSSKRGDFLPICPGTGGREEPGETVFELGGVFDVHDALASLVQIAGDRLFVPPVPMQIQPAGAIEDERCV